MSCNYSQQDRKIISEVRSCLEREKNEREMDDKIEFLLGKESKIINRTPIRTRGLYWIRNKENNDFLCIIEVDTARIDAFDSYVKERDSRINQGVPYYRVDSYEEVLRIVTLIWKEFE